MYLQAARLHPLQTYYDHDQKFGVVLNHTKFLKIDGGPVSAGVSSWEEALVPVLLSVLRGPTRGGGSTRGEKPSSW